MAAAAVDLGQFDDRDVRSTTIAITNAGDGLSKAMKVDPKLMHLGEKVYVVLECEVAKVRFDPIEKDGADLQRVHVLRAGIATIVDGKLVKRALEDQVARIEKARDEETGAQRLGLGFDPLDPDGKGDAAADDDDETPPKAEKVTGAAAKKAAPAKATRTRKPPAKKAAKKASHLTPVD